jgi:hypothetical protein
MAVNLSPVGGVAAQFFNNDGVPLAGGLIYTYAAGSSTPVAAYTEASGSVAHTNPIVLDSAGRVPSGEIWLTDGTSYKFVLKDSTGILIATYDNIVGINSNFVNFTNNQEIQTATAGQTLFTLATMQYQPGTNSLSVFVDGVNQYGPGAQYAYVETSSTSVTFASGLHVGASVKFTTSQINGAAATDAEQVSYNPPFANAVPTNVEAKLAQIVSIKDFGATGDATTDDTVAIQNALDSIQALGGGTVYIPAGEYKITATLNLPPYVSLEGEGQFSILRVYGCDGISIDASSVIGPRRISNFWFYGNGTDLFSAIKCDLDWNAGERSQGNTFQDLYISFFGTGVFGRGFWHTTFNNVVMNQVHTGFYLIDRNIKILIDDCKLTHGGLVSGSGNSVGVHVGPVSVVRPEDVQITDTIIFGFGEAILWRSCLFGGITNCDLDGCSVTGLTLVTADGGFVFNNNWIQVDSSTVTVYGINATALGYTPSIGAIAIQNNRINNTTNTGTGYGMFIGQNQTGLLIDNNSLEGWPTSFRTDASKRLKITNNTFSSTVTILNSANTTIADNYVNDFSFSGNTNLNLGSNVGPLSFGTNPGVTTYAVGGVTLPSGATSVSLAPGTLGLSNFLATSLSYLVTCNINGSTTRNFMWGNVTANNNVTFYVETSLGANETINFCIQAY